MIKRRETKNVWYYVTLLGLTNDRCEPSLLLFFVFIGPDCDCDEGHELSMVWPLFDWNPALSSRTSKREEANDFGLGFAKTIYTMTFHI